MQLNIDLGNTKLKWQLQGKDADTSIHHILNQQIDSLDNLWHDHNIATIKIASVGNATIFNKISQWAKYRNIEFIELKTSKSFENIQNAYGNNYKKLGIDRWLNIIAAYKNYGACFVVSCGSALTLDKIDATGNHLGGFIVPGYAFSIQALKQNTNFLNSAKFIKNHNFYGKDTNSCISLGIDRMLQGLLYQAYNEENLPFILTGGDANLLSQNLSLPYTIVDDLIFKGIQIYK